MEMNKFDVIIIGSGINSLTAASILSKAGKSYVIASSRGRDTFQHDGKNIHVNFNAYVMKEEWESGSNS